MDLACGASVWHEYIDPHHVYGQAGCDLVIAPGIGGLAHTAVVGEQCVGAGLGDGR